VKGSDYPQIASVEIALFGRIWVNAGDINVFLFSAKVSYWVEAENLS
jgi:hypothetical protein